MNGINVNLLKAKLVERGLNVTALADMIKIDRSTLYRKLQENGINITVGEANAIVIALGLSVQEAVAIFFSNKVA